MRKIQRNAVGVAAISVIFAALTMLVRPTTILGRVVESFDSIPVYIHGWRGRNIDSTSASRLLPNSSILMRDYYADDGREANLTLVYGLDIADIHNPEYCFAGQGWGTQASKTISLRPPSGPAHPAKMLLLNDGVSRRYLGIYWYAGQGGARDSVSSQRMQSWRNTLTTGRVRPSALVRILVPIDGQQSESEEAALSLASSLDAPIRRMLERQPKIVRVRRPLGN